MFKKSKSLIFSIVLTRVVFIAIIVSCFTAPFLVSIYDSKYVIAAGQPSCFIPLTVTLYLTAVPAAVLVIALDRLLKNISQDKAFISQNVTCLRIISYCCFAVSVIFIYFGFIRHFAFLIVIAAAFFGLILRVVKNVFEQAVALREENDFTI